MRQILQWWRGPPAWCLELDAVKKWRKSKKENWDSYIYNGPDGYWDSETYHPPSDQNDYRERIRNLPPHPPLGGRSLGAALANAVDWTITEDEARGGVIVYLCVQPWACALPAVRHLALRFAIARRVLSSTARKYYERRARIPRGSAGTRRSCLRQSSKVLLI